MSAAAERDVVPHVVVSAAAGDETAFARLVAEYDDDLVRVAYLVTSDVAMARDAAQAAWAKAWRKLSTVRDPARVKPWLVAISVNEARQLLRRHRRRTVREFHFDAPEGLGGDAYPVEPKDDMWLDLAAAMHRLPDVDRAIIAMRYALGMTSDEIAGAIGMSSAGVRSRLARSLARLRRELDDDGS